MSLFRRLVSTAVAVVLVGCASTVPLQRGQIDSINRDSSPSAVNEALGRATSKAEFELTANGESFAIRHYLLQTGMRQEMTMVCTNFCMPIFYSVPVTADYVVVQRLPSRAMHAWGTIEELSKDQDSTVSSIMPALKSKLEAVTAEKNK